MAKVTPIRERDYGYEAQQAAENHLEAIWAADYPDDPEQEVEYPENMAGPWCGCTTCIVREVLHVAWPILREAALAGAE